jgi:hypothetical protein
LFYYSYLYFSLNYNNPNNIKTKTVSFGEKIEKKCATIFRITITDASFSFEAYIPATKLHAVTTQKTTF